MKAKMKFGSTYGIIGLVIKHSGKSPWLFVLGLLTTTINSIAYLIGIILGGLVVSKTFSKEIFNGQGSFNDPLFLTYIYLMLLCFTVFLIFRILEFRIYILLSYATAKNLREKAMNKLLKMPVAYYDSRKTGDIISTLINDVNNISDALVQILTQGFSHLIHLFLTVIVMLVYSVSLTLIMAAFSTILFSVGFLMIKKARPNIKKVWDDFAQINAYVEEGMKNMKITKTFGRQKESTEGFMKIAKNIYNHAFVGDLYTQMFIPWFIMSTNFLVLVTAALSLVFSNNNIHSWGLIQGVPDAGFVLGFIGLVHSATGALQAIFGTVFSSQNGVISSVRIREIGELITPDTTRETVQLGNNIRGHIKFENVSFRYDKTKDNWQLKNASFEVLPGQVVALVGPTGAGKTTIINMLSKFYEYETGSITIDGIELKNITKESLNNNAAVVLQDSYMFKDTVANNILIGNTNATKDDLEQATSIVSAHDSILRLQQGYDTKIEDDNMILSKGEKQLISIARAILGNKKILILDEATSNIDTNTEKIIQDALANSIMKNKTSIVIAHRLSTIKNADLILLVDDGQIIERGNHATLLEQNGRYAALYHSQLN